jgi:hypothetical protein
MNRLSIEDLEKLIVLCPKKFKGYLTLFGGKIKYKASDNNVNSAIVEFPIPNDRLIELNLVQELAEYLKQIVHKEYLLILIKGVY